MSQIATSAPDPRENQDFSPYKPFAQPVGAPSTQVNMTSAFAHQYSTRDYFGNARDLIVALKNVGATDAWAQLLNSPDRIPSNSPILLMPGTYALLNIYYVAMSPLTVTVR